MSADKSQDNTENQQEEGDKLRELLLKEIEETNTWARAGAQLYFGWFTIMLTINGVGASWLFKDKGPMPAFTTWICIVFIVLDLLGVIVTFLICRQMLGSSKRINDILAGLISQLKTGGHKEGASNNDRLGTRPQSPMPLTAIITAFSFTGAGLCLVMIFWVVLAIRSCYPNCAI